MTKYKVHYSPSFDDKPYVINTLTTGMQELDVGRVKREVSKCGGMAAVITGDTFSVEVDSGIKKGKTIGVICNPTIEKKITN
jgi:hypothetical protein